MTRRDKKPRTVPIKRAIPTRTRLPDIVSREFTIHMSKRLYGITFKNRAPRAVREVKLFAQKAMKTKDVRLDVGMNKYLWSHGIKNLPKRVRVRITRKRNEDEDAKEKLYSVVTYVPVTDFKGLTTTTVDA